MISFRWSVIDFSCPAESSQRTHYIHSPRVPLKFEIYHLISYSFLSLFFFCLNIFTHPFSCTLVKCDRSAASISGVVLLFFLQSCYYRPCAFFSLFLVTRPRSFWLKTKKKKNWGSQNQSCWPSVSCAQHLHVAPADSIEWTSQFLHGYCDEEEELSPYPLLDGGRW